MYQGDHAEQVDKQNLSNLIYFIFLAVLVLFFAWLVHTRALQPYEIPSGSMEPTIMTNDKVLAEKFSYMFGQPKRGDIVTFDDPHINSRVLIKRIIAMDGDVVDLKNGYVYINGERQDEPYADGKSYPLDTTGADPITYPYTVPEGYMWVMGDNRENSSDSRYFGSVPKSSIISRAFVVLYPFEHFKGI